MDFELTAYTNYQQEFLYTQFEDKNPFPKYADYHFTYNNTTDDLAFIEEFNLRVEAASQGQTNKDYNPGHEVEIYPRYAGARDDGGQLQCRVS